MPRLTLEIESTLYDLLKQAAQANQSTLEQECIRRLEGGVRHSRYMQALLAEMRAEEEQKRADSSR